MLRPHDSKRGFTLVELLTVIAIIGILAGFTFAVLPNFLTGAKVASTQNTLKQVATALVDYYTEHNTYPPAYGYLTHRAFKDDRDRAEHPEYAGVTVQTALLDPTDPNNDIYFESEFYMNKLGLHKSLEHYDNFSLESSDTDYDQVTGLLEYYPEDGRDDVLQFDDQAIILGQRPLIYVPVNLRQFRQAKKIWDANPAGGFPDWLTPEILAMDFPPANYDAFVLISAGPVNNTQGLVYTVGGGVDRLNPPNNYPESYWYHLAGLATYYMMTRDIDNDGQYDFDYEARRSGGQGSILFPYSQRTDRNGTNLPKRGAGIDGPVYKVVQ